MSDQTTALPIWDELSDLDKGAVLLHLHKREWEGDDYAVEEYPAEYFDHPALLALDQRAACDFAVTAGGDFDDLYDQLGEAEYQRLYDLALDADTARTRAQIEARKEAQDA